MNDGYLRSVPSDSNPNDGRLNDPTVPDSGGGVTVIPGTLALVTSLLVPILALAVVPPQVGLTTNTSAPVIATAIIPPQTSLTIASFASTLALSVVPGTSTLIINTFAPVGALVVIPGTSALTLSTTAPVDALAVIPGKGTLALATSAPVLAQAIIPGTTAVAISMTAPVNALAVIPTTKSLSLSTSAPVLALSVIPSVASVSVAGLLPTLALAVVPPPGVLEPVVFPPDVTFGSGDEIVEPDTLALTLTTFAPEVLGITEPVYPLQPPYGSFPVARARYVQRIKVTIPPARLRLTTRAPRLQTHVEIRPRRLVLSAFAPTIVEQVRIVPVTARLRVKTHPVITRQSIVIRPLTESVRLDAYAPELVTGLNVLEVITFKGATLYLYDDMSISLDIEAGASVDVTVSKGTPEGIIDIPLLKIV